MHTIPCPVRGRLDDVVTDDRRRAVWSGPVGIRPAPARLLTPEAGSRPVREGSAGACPRLPTHHACRPLGARRSTGDERAGRGLRPAAAAARGCGGLRRLGRRLEAGAARAGRPTARSSVSSPATAWPPWRRPPPAWRPAPTRWIAPARRPGPRSRSPSASCRTSCSRGWPACSADLLPRSTVLAWSCGLRAVLIAASAGVMLLDGPVGWLVVLAVLSAVAATPAYPSVAASVPQCVPDSGLERWNAVATGVENLAWLVGPGLFGLLMVLGCPPAVVAVVAAVVCAVAVVPVLGVRLAAAGGPCPRAGARPRMGRRGARRAAARRRAAPAAGGHGAGDGRQLPLRLRRGDARAAGRGSRGSPARAR